jgi:rhodanese-related sulfurtransferase
MRSPVFFLFWLIGLSCNAGAQKQDVDVNAFEHQITNKDVQILDVRTPDEYAGGHIKNAMLANWVNKDEFTERVKYLDKTKPVLVYCASGGRSSQASQWLASNGFKQVENLTGGFNQWKLENKPFDATTNVTQLTIDQY